MRKGVWAFTAIGILSLLMVDLVHPTGGGHSSTLVLAPYPTLSFEQGGGEEGAWERAHPGEEKPWWLRGAYLKLLEIPE